MKIMYEKVLRDEEFLKLFIKICDAFGEAIP